MTAWRLLCCASQQLTFPSSRLTFLVTIDIWIQASLPLDKKKRTAKMKRKKKKYEWRSVFTMKWITAIHWSVNECKSQLLHQNTVGWHSFSIFRCFTFSTQWFFGRSSLHIAIWAVTPSLRFVTSNNNNNGRAKKNAIRKVQNHSRSAHTTTTTTATARTGAPVNAITLHTHQTNCT